LRLESTHEEARLFQHTTLIGEAKRSGLDLQVPPSPSYEEAAEAARSYPGFHSHSFPGCFVCGPERVAHEGLCIFPGSVSGSSLIAAPWIPDASLADASAQVSSEFLWAALDCPGAFAHFPLPDGIALVLGELTVSLLDTLRPGERCVVLGWPLSVEGRKRLSGTAIYAPNGRLVGLARAVWIEVPSSTWD
jgi:hypothetical protein